MLIDAAISGDRNVIKKGSIEVSKQNSCNIVFPRDIVCFRNISKNILHKGDDDDDNNNSTKEMRQKRK